MDLIGLYIESHSLGGDLIPNFHIKLSSSDRIPDLLYVSPSNIERIKEFYVDGAADMVIEISTKETMVRDRAEKYYEYESAGISEY